VTSLWSSDSERTVPAVVITNRKSYFFGREGLVAHVFILLCNGRDHTITAVHAASSSVGWLMN